jgi:hypothetical protein
MAPAETKIIPAANSEATSNIVALPSRPEPVTATEKALGFVKEHPVLTIAGGLAAGLLISSLIPRRANRGLTKRALRIAEAGAAAALSFGQDTYDRAEDGGILARKKAKAFGKQAEKLGDRAAARAEKLASSAAARAEKLSGKAVAHAERLGVAALGTAGVWGQAAAERADKLGHAAAVHAESLGERASDRLSQLSDRALVRSSKLIGYPKAPASFIDRLLDKVRDLVARGRG